MFEKLLSLDPRDIPTLLQRTKVMLQISDGNCWIATDGVTFYVNESGYQPTISVDVGPDFFPKIFEGGVSSLRRADILNVKANDNLKMLTLGLEALKLVKTKT